MEVGLHNTSLKKSYSQIFDSAATQPINATLNTDIQPVTPVIPYLNIVKVAQGSETMYTVPTDRQFYLTNVSLNVNRTEGTGTSSSCTCTFQPIGQPAVTVICLCAASATVGGDSNSSDIVFPLRGVQLEPGSAVTSANGGTAMSAMIAGYTTGNGA